MTERTRTSEVQQVLDDNRAFLRASARRRPAVPGRPAKHMAVLTCMDTRLTRMLPEALGLHDGDANIIKVAGGTIVEPYGEAMRSLVVAVAELGVTDVLVIGHTNCGTCGMRPEHMMEELVRAGVSRERLDAAVEDDQRAAAFLKGFDRVDDEVSRNVRTIREHPLMPEQVNVFGFVIDIETGALAEVCA